MSAANDKAAREAREVESRRVPQPNQRALITGGVVTLAEVTAFVTGVKDFLDSLEPDVDTAAAQTALDGVVTAFTMPVPAEAVGALAIGEVTRRLDQAAEYLDTLGLDVSTAKTALTTVREAFKALQYTPEEPEE